MAETYQVRLTAQGGWDLNRIYDYIEQHSPQNAREVVRALLNAIDSLEHFPHRYPVVADSESLFQREVRSMPVRPFRIRYHVDDRQLSVTVLSVEHGAQLG